MGGMGGVDELWAAIEASAPRGADCFAFVDAEDVHTFGELTQSGLCSQQGLTGDGHISLSSSAMDESVGQPLNDFEAVLFHGLPRCLRTLRRCTERCLRTPDARGVEG